MCSGIAGALDDCDPGGGNGVLFHWPYIVFAEQWLRKRGHVISGSFIRECCASAL